MKTIKTILLSLLVLVAPSIVTYGLIVLLTLNTNPALWSLDFRFAFVIFDIPMMLMFLLIYIILKIERK